ncbi:SRPBCC family protein [Isoptericola sediminis]|uniref:SRPBCC family protein n=1 Tax=Isoptericola sediminis TaxID=2733572 RepID=A0A849JYG2_9MICO|nr:SRPBCC family protein [Isoptericola sediminis]NNU27594.1 SRPBCC family protein [Isoptericola sediminis]
MHPHRVEVSRVVPVPANVAFAWVADPRTHPRFIPLTHLSPEPTAPLGPGDTFTMVSGPGIRRGLPGFPDRMTITAEQRPSTRAGTIGRSAVRKEGPYLRGVAGFDVVPVDLDRTRIVWWEEAYLAGPWPRRANEVLVGLILRGMMHASLYRLSRLLQRRR